MRQTLNAGEICTRTVTFAERSTELQEAARLMREQHVGSLVVVDETERGRLVVGMLTDRDIVTAVVAPGVDVATLRVGDVMSRDVVTVREDEPLMDVMATMRRSAVRRLPVVGPQRQLVGLVSLDDALEVVAQELDVLVQAIGSQRKREQSGRP